MVPTSIVAAMPGHGATSRVGTAEKGGGRGWLITRFIDDAPNFSTSRPGTSSAVMKPLSWVNPGRCGSAPKRNAAILQRNHLK